MRTSEVGVTWWVGKKARSNDVELESVGRNVSPRVDSEA